MEKTLTLSKTIKLQDEILNYHHTVKVDRCATLKDGIRKLSKPSRRRYLRKCSKLAGNYSICNFIPASGSGSRLFAHLINFCKNFDSENESFSNYINRTKSYPLHDLFVHIKNFGFNNDIPKEILHSNGNSISSDDRKLLIARYLIEELEIHKIPKALQLFHEVDNKYYSALYQQYKLHKKLCKDFGKSSFHITIDKQFDGDFKDEISKFMTIQDDVEMSHQSKSTDAICLDKHNNLVFAKDRKPLKKPSGHGALLENLNDIDSDIIHLHNIDNIPHDRLHKKLVKEKRILLGYLLFIQQKAHRYLRYLEEGTLTSKRYKRLQRFCEKHLHINFKYYLKNSEVGKMTTIYRLLNRPIRVCGMVPTTSHSGGGPLWVEENDGAISLQIVESIEIDPIVNPNLELNNTHFNPVEIFCAVKNYKGEKFDLMKYANSDRKMLVDKQYNGREIKFLEQPGLWNGGMHDWLTVFVEIDKNCFNPVKKIEDLLSENHQSN